MGKDSVAVVAQVIALRRSRVRLTDRPLPLSCHGMQRTKRPSRTSASLAITSRWMHQGASLSGAVVPIHGSAPLPLRGGRLLCIEEAYWDGATHTRLGSWSPRSHVCA